MYLFDNPVLQRELLVNLRMNRAFLLLAAYVLLLGGVVWAAWPEARRIDMTNPEAAQTLVSLFFLGQYVLASLMAPSFAAGSISGEKERKTYEMLLASPLRPGAIVVGKLLASLTHVGVLIVASLPIVMLCLPLGGVSLYEVLTLYFALILSVSTFAMISLACSSYFARSAAALVVSYFLILPLSLLGLAVWQVMGFLGGGRLVATVTMLPLFCGAICGALFVVTSRRLLHPPDVGSEGKEVIDETHEAKSAVGLVIQRDQFPDRLFAPPKRKDLLPDGANPIYDKEMRSELFSQGTLMLRVVIQASMALAIPLMAVCLYIWPMYAPWYICYTLLFNLLVSPVFLAGTVTSERERQTLDLLLCTILSPWTILTGKLLSGLRVSLVLTSFLLWPLVLACAMVNDYWTNLTVVAGYVGVILVASLTSASVALYCSAVFHRTSVSIMTAYLCLALLFFGPVATAEFGETILPAEHPALGWLNATRVISPFTAAQALPISVRVSQDLSEMPNWTTYGFYMLGAAILNAVLYGLMIWRFHARWKAAN